MSSVVDLIKPEPFDYSILPQETADALQQCEQRIYQAGTEAILKIGEQLVTAQGLLANHGDGTFMAWATHVTGMGKSTIYNILKARTMLEDRPNFGQSLSIGRSALYLLASSTTPKSARDEVFEMAQDGEHVTHATAKAIVKEHQAGLQDDIAYWLTDKHPSRLWFQVLDDVQTHTDKSRYWKSLVQWIGTDNVQDKLVLRTLLTRLKDKLRSGQPLVAATEPAPWEQAESTGSPPSVTSDVESAIGDSGAPWQRQADDGAFAGAGELSDVGENTSPPLSTSNGTPAPWLQQEPVHPYIITNHTINDLNALVRDRTIEGIAITSKWDGDATIIRLQFVDGTVVELWAESGMPEPTPPHRPRPVLAWKEVE